MRDRLHSTAVAIAASALALSTAAHAMGSLNRGGPYQIYIFDDRDGRSTYALSVAKTSAAATVENCVGRLADDPDSVVAQLRKRATEKGGDLNLVTVDGKGSGVHLGDCADKHESGDEKDDDRSDSLVLVRNASARQALNLIREMPLTPAEQDKMIAALGLDR